MPFAVFAMPAVINAKNAEHTDDRRRSGVASQGFMARTRIVKHGRGQQQPLLLIHVEYKDPFYRIGYLEDMVSIIPEKDEWREEEKRPSSVQDIAIDLNPLLKEIRNQEDKIARCRIWCHPSLNVQGEISEFLQPLW